MDRIDQLVAKERELQDNKWGEQNHGNKLWLAILVEEVGEAAALVNEVAPIDWTLAYELIQVMAVCKVWIECGLRNQCLELPTEEDMDAEVHG